MEIIEIIKGRRSIRDFYDKEISKEIIEELIEAIIWAPSAGNLQSRKFYFIFNKALKEKVARSVFQNFILKAPLVIIACTDNRIIKRYGERGKNLYAICDVSVSVQNLMLVAYAKGLGSCFVGAFDEEELIKILNLPENLRPIAIIPIGYPAEKPKPPPRVSKQEAVEFIE